MSGEALTLDEIKSIAFSLQIDMDMICTDTQTKATCAREMIRYCVARNELDVLRGALFTLRPDLRDVYYD